MNQSDANDNQAASNWLNAAEASALLGIKRATLYAYVSRGKVRTRATGRRHSYLRHDIERLRARRDARSGHGAVAAGALRWGEPVLDSEISELRPEGHRYRGASAHVLAAEGASLESVAELVWGTCDEVTEATWPQATLPLAPNKLAALLGSEARPVDAMAVALPAMGLADPARLHDGRAATLRVARRLVRLLVACAGLPCGAARVRQSLGEPNAARGLLVAVGARAGMNATAAVQLALVLCADHELNPSSFAARVAASAGADLYACVGAALATLTGPRHGGMPERVDALLEEIDRPERAARVISERLRRGDEVPGFGHPLYPHGDPRTAPIMAAARCVAPRSRLVRTTDALIDAMALAGAQPPTLDVALVALAAALRLGPGGGAALFACGRIVGWVAHVLEQREAGFLLRPRARYVGL